MSAEFAGLAERLRNEADRIKGVGCDYHGWFISGCHNCEATNKSSLLREAATELAARRPDGPGIQPLGPQLKTEQDVRRALADLQAEYQMRAEPFVKILCDIEARKPPRPFFIVAAPTGGQHGK